MNCIDSHSNLGMIHIDVRLIDDMKVTINETHVMDFVS